MMYLAGSADGGGPWLYSLDVERRIPHRLSTDLDRYTSLAASADGHRLVATLANPKRTVWRLQISEAAGEVSKIARIPLKRGTGTVFSPRLGPNYLLYVAASNSGEGIWKLANEKGTELWSDQGARIIGSPAISSDGRFIAFSVQQRGRKLLYVVREDGTNARVVNDSLDLEGSPAWAPDGKSIATAANDHGVLHLFNVSIDGGAPVLFVKEYATDPTWAPNGRFVVYSGADIGTKFSLRAATPEAATHAFPDLALTRGARHVAFLNGGRELIYLRGELQHKNVWLRNLETGAERPLTNLGRDFDIRDFDISPDGHEVVLERSQEHSDVVLMDIPRP